MENKARQNNLLRDSLDDKIKAYDDYKQFVQEIIKWSDRHEEVCNLSQPVLEICADANFVEQVGQFKSRYRNLLAQTKVSTHLRGFTRSRHISLFCIFKANKK